MREIKFRAWCEKHECFEMIYDNVRWSGKGMEAWCEQEDSITYWPLILMQYTGLKDKGGVEIYEGDIIEEVGSLGTSSFAKIVWDEYLERGDLDLDCLIVGFVREWTDGTKSPFGYNVNAHSGMEIIGNIYENGDLLE